MMTDSISRLKDSLEETLLQPNENANVEKSERVLSLFSGAFIFCKGVSNLFSHPMLALGEVIVGGTLLHRGVTGYCSVKALAEQEPQVVTETIFITEMEQPSMEQPGRDPSSIGAG